MVRKVFTTISIVLLCLIWVKPLAGQGKLDLNPHITYQIIDGFGASDAWRVQFVGKNWPLEKREQMADWLFSMDLDKKGNPKGIGLSLWRYYIGAGSTEQKDKSGIPSPWRRAESYLNSDGTYDWSKAEGQAWFLDAAKKRGVPKFLAFTIAPPVHFALNGLGYSIPEDGRMNIIPGKLQDYAEFLTHVLAHFDSLGHSFDYISPVNEPQWDWSKGSQEGTPATNEEVYLFVKYLSDAISKRKLNTKIVVGEAGSLEYLYEKKDKPAAGDQVDVFFKQTSPLSLVDFGQVEKLITGHSYFTTWPISKLIDTRKSLRDKLNEVDELRYWQSEFCILEESPEIGGGQKRDLGMATALYVARVIHADLSIANASSWQWWTALTTADFKDGLIYLDTGDDKDLFNEDRLIEDGDFHDSKLMWALGNYSRFIRPGMQRIQCNLENSALEGTAYQDAEGEFVVVLINHTEIEERLQIESSLTVQKLYVTDQNNNLTSSSLFDNQLNIPPRSIITLTGTISAN
ncbi:hypothetical protein MM213_12755 [Belliella sp. R4-6]|uniref:O-Glycosyl hydrolase n=1 Tax=Belliella alkalica TaxID=1730871 RepID=A0ABS9VD46_9BACT|nr:glycoside hydrolase [Belliella alkalica]MCH7414361.1 hypothetical protein [Belliella alkalica]